MNRFFKIEKFRNIGIDKEEKLLINSSLKEGEQGNLIILVGENNSGKSNVLEALMCFKNGSVQDRDVTNLEFDEKYSKPILTMVTQDGNKEFSCSLKYGDSSYTTYSNVGEYSEILSVNDALRIYDSLSQYKAYPSDFKATFENEKATRQEIEDAIKSFLNLLRKDLSAALSHKSNHHDGRGYDNRIDGRGYDNRISTYLNIYNWLDQHFPTLVKVLTYSEFDLFNNLYMKHFDVNVVPNIVVYKEKNISDNDLSCVPDSINSFLTSVLEDIEFKKEDVISAYKIYRNQKNIGILKKLETKLNKKVAVISKKFNSIYKLDDGCYEFAFRVESTHICLIVSKNEEPLTLEFQSTGFRWFFNLYFNLLSKNTMQPGDIIIMDEPATHLHVQGQQELRKFLKDFTVKTGVTIILATHSPFLVDVDNLDELRIIKNINGRATIQNDFSAIDADNSDTLASIIKALTVKTHILSDPDKQMVFVEGITDYNTFTKTVKLLGEEYKTVSFLPVNGIGKNREQQKKVLKSILEIGRKRNPILLVDGDKAGEAIKELNGDNKDLLVISLSEIDPEFKEIEDLFTENDRIKFGIQKENGKYVKSSILSSNIKNYRTNKDFSEETKNNLKKVLDYIVEKSS